MLSGTTRILTGITGSLFLLLGVVMFVAPDWSGANFSWPLTRLLAMTMGGWYLGASVMALVAVRRWHWPEVYGCLVFTWAFGILEAGVLLRHREVLQMEAPLAWPYVAILAWAGVAGVLGILDWVRRRPAIAARGLALPGWMRLLNLLFVLAVAALALYALGGEARGGSVWPAVLPPLEVGGFGAFYAAIALGALALVPARHLAPYRVYAYAGLSVIALVLVPALLHRHSWDLAAKPLGFVYFAAYVGVAVVTLIWLAVLREPSGVPAERR